MEFCAIVKRIRQKFGLSQEQLSREISINFSKINCWENGKLHPSQMEKKLFYNFCKDKNIDINFYMKGEV